MKRILLAGCLLLATIAVASAQNYLGNYTSNPYMPPAPPQPPGTFTNSYGNSSNSPQLYNNQGQYRGNLNSNSLRSEQRCQPLRPIWQPIFAG